MKPEIIATRAVHQYRRRDLVTYVGLRQHLLGKSSRRDLWAQQVALDLTTTATAPAYHRVHFFKEAKPDGTIEFRDLYLPAPTEALAEGTLLAACAEAGGVFESRSSVYSYRLCRGSDREGFFRAYFRGFSERHQAIAEACDRVPDSIVVYTDIRKFYPSISREVASRVWSEACGQASLPTAYRQLGEVLLRRHASIGRDALLTGPMFSHLIGNLVLAPIDHEFEEVAPGRYFRYVDDIAFVGTPSEVEQWEKRLHARLGSLGLELHGGKRIETSARDWLPGRGDFTENSKVSWKRFIGQMKQELLGFPFQREPLRELFRTCEFRIYPLDYTAAARERPFAERMLEMARNFDWFRRSNRKRTLDTIAGLGLELRHQYMAQLQEWLDRFPNLENYQKKRALYRLRALSSRLVYLAASKDLQLLADATAGIDELAVTSTLFDALAKRDVTALLRYGPAAAQNASQAFRAMGGEMKCAPQAWSEAAVQAYAILRLNGVQLVPGPIPPPQTNLVQFSESRVPRDIFEIADPYFRELFSVRGAQADLNRAAVETAFDADDELEFELQELVLGQSY